MEIQDTSRSPEIKLKKSLRSPHTILQAFTTPLLSPLAKLRILGEPLVRKSKKEDETIASFISRRLGSEVNTRIASAALHGVWAAPTDTLSIRSTMNSLWELEKQHGSLLLGMIKHAIHRDKEKPKYKPRIISFAHGMAQLTEALANSLPAETLHLAHAVTSVERHENSFVVTIMQDESSQPTTIDAETVVVTTPAVETSKIIQSLAPKLTRLLTKQRYAPLGMLHLAYPKTSVSHSLEGFGFLKPPLLSKGLLGALFHSSMFPNDSPPDTHLITCFCGGATVPTRYNVDEGKIQESIIQELNSLIGSSHQPQIVHSHTWEKAIPTYGIQHYKFVEAIEACENYFPSLFFLTNWKREISLSGRVAEAQLLGEKIKASYLGAVAAQ